MPFLFGRYAAHFSIALPALLFAGLVLRDAGLYPTVFADELAYSTLARLAPLSEAAYPDYLYFGVFRFTNYCGDGFLGCARVLNALSFVAATPFIYMVARTVAGNTASAWIAALALLGPVNSYTAYFMPESFFFFGFWAFAWSVLRLDAGAQGLQWAWAGAIYGLLALIKPHAVFFLPAVLIYLAYISTEQRTPFGNWLRNAAIVIATSASIKFGLGYLLAGPSALSLFGQTYGSIASAAWSGPRALELFRVSLHSLKGHLLVLALIYGVPSALAIAVLLSHPKLCAPGDRLARISAFSILLILNLICVTALFTASVAETQMDNPDRLHLRYYDFALPLLYMVAVGCLSAGDIVRRGSLRYVITFVICTGVIWAAYTRLDPYISSFVDNPEFRGLRVNRPVFRFFGVLSMALLIAWAVRGQVAVRLYVYVALPLCVAISTYSVTLEQRGRLVPDAYDDAGIFVRRYLQMEDLSKLVIVGSEPAGLFRTMFYLDNPKAIVETIARGGTYDVSNVAAGREWVLLIGDHPVRGAASPISMKGFALMRASGSVSGLED